MYWGKQEKQQYVDPKWGSGDFLRSSNILIFTCIFIGTCNWSLTRVRRNKLIITMFLRINFTINFPSTPKSTKPFISFMCSYQNTSGTCVTRPGNIFPFCINKIQQVATVCRYLFTAGLLYVFRASIAPIIRSTKNCNCSLWYRSYYVTVQRPSSNVAYRLQLQFFVLMMDARNT